MRSTLFHIPTQFELGGITVPLIGWGLLLVLWAFCGGGFFAWHAARHGLRSAATTLGLPLALVAAP